MTKILPELATDHHQGKDKFVLLKVGIKDPEMLIVPILLTLAAAIIVLLPGLSLFPLRQPASMPLWMVKVYASALAPFLLFAGILLIIFGWAWSYPVVMVLATIGVSGHAYHIYAVSRPPAPATGFTAAYGSNWEAVIPPERKSRMLPVRYTIKLPASPDPFFEQDVVFHNIPGTARQLVCDIWQPPVGTPHSGLAFIYLHGSAWTLLDKDFGTRTFFRHLTRQGHLIMDVAYRLFPETDMRGMVHDAKHAIAWLKARVETYGIDPEKIVIGGGSAGGHIALLAAYTTQIADFTPSELQEFDLGVRAVIALYAPADLAATYYHNGQHLVRPGKSKSAPKPEKSMPGWIPDKMGANFHRLGFDKSVEPGMLAPMLGGTPAEVPDSYRLYSPITYVRQDSPPTLLIQGQHDIISPVKATRQLYDRLRQNGVPAVLHLIPQCDHAFDLILPRTSPSAHNAYFGIERFLELQRQQTTPQYLRSTTPGAPG